MSAALTAWNWIREAPRRRIGVRVLQQLVGVFLLLRVAAEWATAPLFWGPSGWAIPFSAAVGRHSVALGRVFSSDGMVQAALLVLTVSAVLLILGFWVRIGALVGLIAYWMLENRLPDANDGGDVVARLLLLYMLLFVGPREKTTSAARTWFHNLGVIVVTSQACIIYLAAAAAKACGTPWMHGTAVYAVSQNKVHSSEFMREVFGLAAVTTLATYGIMLLQVWFPLALVSRFRRVWIALAVLFHLWTAFEMKIVTFSLVMIALDLALLTDAEYFALRSRLARALPLGLFGAARSRVFKGGVDGKDSE